MIKSDIEHLRWCYCRMVKVHGENRLVDYMQKFDSIIEEERELIKSFIDKKMTDMNDDKYIHEFQNEGFNWFAVDMNGAGNEYTREPNCDDASLWTYNSSYSEYEKVKHSYKGNWKDSLQQRGIAIDDASIKLEEKVRVENYLKSFKILESSGPQAYTFPARDGGTASVELKPGEILIKDRDGFFHVETEMPLDWSDEKKTERLMDGYVTRGSLDIGPKGGIPGAKLENYIEVKIEPVKSMTTRDKLIAMLDDNETWERIALEACLEQQKVIDKAEQIQVVAKAYDVTCETIGNPDTVANSEYRSTLLNSLYDAGMLTLPGDPS